MEMFTGRMIVRAVAMAGVGVVVGVLGTAVHRGYSPWGLVLALALVLSAALLARAWAGWLGMLLLAVGTFSSVSVLAGPGPADDVLIALQPVGMVWYAGAGVVFLAALAPSRWFSDRPVEPGTRGAAEAGAGVSTPGMTDAGRTGA
ncbi:hypothetical protein [Cellulomonas bogoriensis]|uniref:Uncharacterized protein n=1 Tax=Cellulomonas bogoriensis 69B4 = DSM 16987 TaxID=1386082 RepID=A0A0A0C131_9CELL|nr:hypothetical protein [Cellulomonas bogoriensis]KGM13885.1 hypothetical protein N869_08055 [Cellulomonas bogoriensis 69B4 = DSM 16987]